MIEIMKARLPEGLKVVKVVDRTGWNQMKVELEYEGTKFTTFLYKTCAPGRAEHLCDMTIAIAMTGIAIERADFEMCTLWVAKQKELSQEDSSND